ncbi:RNA polymerase sigma factor [Patescibacteria group bacterium]|nr:RNA polymerase sigma factor [Patescibacteria group bacterium]
MPKIQDLSDEKLVEYVRSQDQEQYREITNRYQRKLLRYAESITKDKFLAQDVVQQAFIKAFINLYSFNIKKKFSSWIYRIVHNEAINHLKKYKRELNLKHEHWQNLESNDKSIEKSLIQKDKKEKLLAALKELPVNYRAPLTLRYFDKKSYEEISNILKIPTGTVGTRINRGKKELRQLFNRIYKGR